MTFLLFDEDPAARTLLARAIGGHFQGLAVPAPTLDECQMLGESLTELDVFVAAPRPGDEAGVLALRDQLRSRFPALRTLFLASTDFGPFRDRIGPADALFYQPADVQAMVNWIARPVSGLERGSQTVVPPSMAFPPAVEDEPKTELVEPAEQAIAVQATEPAAIPVMVAEADGLPPMPVGTVLGDYELLQFVSRGGTSDRFIALQRSIDRRVGLRIKLLDAT
jgi:hypothetical protein